MLKHLINLFFPRICAGCTTILLTNESVICTSCRHNLPLTNHHLATENEAYKKFYGRVLVEHASALLYFHKKGIVQELIHNLKYKGHEEIGTLLGHWYGQDLKEVLLSQKPDVIIPVPLHSRKYKERGYNQVTSFGLALSKELAISYNSKLLIRTVYSKTQSKKNLIGRAEGIENLFDVTFTESDHGKHFLLVDDVITTGSTLEACSRALLKIPNVKISIVCMAMAQS
ncbi:MAG: ComF family protein [Flavobacteriaceae bacterium]|uniref:ComF family protein n=1 Tax=Flavobacterium kayseriense TaxID=2764714 RepID=A0ABR7J445_9FLAO|nr:phosphoribosyltransferase family protein [Flavobacterium kayseriense]MBC5840315.1 ComF family protein [Flavobacterium kayseriense]MBC5847015.1 ComF family protein [Flavobacterium kayseriense]MBU0941706.1 ComF family protein [Bacteroidota bacterium]MBX9888129.1 ComF family protein [Flavobacteriaceae bacterium]